jgi:short-subunit dehydrogenase
MDCESAVGHVIEREGRVDALINNAGSHLRGAAIETSEAELRGQLELNCLGAVHMTQAVLRGGMIERRSGRALGSNGPSSSRRLRRSPLAWAKASHE